MNTITVTYGAKGTPYLSGKKTFFYQDEATMQRVVERIRKYGNPKQVHFGNHIELTATQLQELIADDLAIF